MKNLFLIAIGYSLVCGVAFSTPSTANIYSEELFLAISSEQTILGRTARLGSGMALGMLRLAQWHDYLGETQHRSARWRDTLGYIFMENEIASFADRCYVLPKAELPQLYAIASECAQKLNIAVPLLLLVDDRKLVDATAACWATASGFVVLSRGAFEETTAEQFCGILSHQMSLIALRYQAQTTKFFAPAFVVGLAVTLYALSKIRGADHSISLIRGIGCLAMLGTFGVAASAYWCALSRYYEQMADQAVAAINPRDGLAMIDTLERCYKENLGGDLEVARDIIVTLPHLPTHDAIKTQEIVGVMEKAYSAARNAEVLDLGIFGTHQSLAKRRAYFTQVIMKQGQHA